MFNNDFPSPSTPLVPPSSLTMASRNLALNLQRSLRNRAALNSIKPITRSFATPVSHGAKTESTTLSNGFTVRFLYRLKHMELTYLQDCDRAFAMGSDIYSRCVDRRRESSRDGQDQRHCTLPRTSCLQGIYHLGNHGSASFADIRRYRAPSNERNTNWNWKLRTWVATSTRTHR